jgi:hypothetical protein
MSNTPITPADQGEPDIYEIRLRGHLDQRWAARLGVPSLVHEAGGATVLRSNAMDQPALHGLLQRIRDLSLPLISVVRIDSKHPSTDPTYKT